MVIVKQARLKPAAPPNRSSRDSHPDESGLHMCTHRNSGACTAAILKNVPHEKIKKSTQTATQKHTPNGNVRKSETAYPKQTRVT